MRYLASTARASSKLVGSGTVGPEAITAGSSPGTSEIAIVTTRAGIAAAASRPPLIAERCLRTALISLIVAPERSSARVTACLSASVMPGAGSESRAEPPPDTRNTNWSSDPSPRARSRMRCAAACPAASGTGWLASTISIRSHGTPWPWRVTTSPLSSPGHRPSKARAIAADALPAPTTTVRPGTAAGRAAAIVR